MTTLISSFDVNVVKRSDSSVVIAANDDVGDGFPIDLRSMEIEGYKKNPVVFFNHDRYSIPVARTTKLERTADGHITADFEFLKNDPVAERVENAWKQGFINAASITARRGADGRHHLREWSIVGLPADPDALRQRSAILDDVLFGGRPMENKNKNDEFTQRLEDFGNKLVERIGEKYGIVEKDDGKSGDNAGLSLDAINRSVQEGIKSFQEAERVRQENERKARETAKEAVERGVLIEKYRDRLPKNAKIDEMSRRDVLVAAVGSAVENATERTEEYLQAFLDMEETRRSKVNIDRGVDAPPGSGFDFIGTSIMDVKRYVNNSRPANSRG